MDEDWLFPEQARLSALYLETLDTLASLHETAGDREAAVAVLEACVRADPLSETARGRLIRLHRAAGRPAVALAHYRDLERRLRQELDLSPSAELAGLAAELTGVRPEPGTGTGAAAPEEEDAAYLPRQADLRLERALARRESIVLVKGSRGTGKSTLLARGLRRARKDGARVVFSDLRSFSADQVATLEQLYRAFAEALADQLDLETPPTAAWNPAMGASTNLRRYVRRHALAGEGPLVWALDEADRLFEFPYFADVFGLFRSWHNERASDPGGPWKSLTLALAYSTEAHLHMPDLDLSPFNVGVRVELEDLTPEQVAEMARRAGARLETDAELCGLFALVGGHPYLVRRALDTLSRPGACLAGLEETADGPLSPFAGYLRRVLAPLHRDKALAAAVARVLRGQGCPSEDHFFRLRSAGIVVGETPAGARPRCGLYARYLSRHLASSAAG